MGNEKDITEKLLEEYNDVFADIINVLAFDGREVIKPDDLEDFLPKSQYKIENGIIHEEERDIGKKWKNRSIIFSKIGLENQTRLEKNMPIRIIGYDGANYREQLICEKTGAKQDYYFPVVSFVLNFSMTRWKRTNLLSCIKVPDELAPFVSDYHINVFDVAFLTDEQVRLFKSDFGIVADYFVCCRKKKKFRFPDKLPKHVDEVLKLLQAVTGDVRFTDNWKIVESSVKEGRKTMGEAWMDAMEARGEARGEIKGMIRAFNIVGYSVEDIAERVGKSVEYVKQIINGECDRGTGTLSH